MAKPYVSVGKWEYLGAGGEATAYKGTISLEIATRGALEIPKRLDVVNRVDKDGFGSAAYPFIGNVAVALLDVYFYLSGNYSQRHVPQPVCLSRNIGLPDNGYIYQFVRGREAFPWRFSGDIVTLKEWR